MSDLEKEKRELPCPSCKRAIKTTFGEIISRREAKCTSCGSKYLFDSSTISAFRTSISNLVNAQEKFAESYEKVIEKADILLKK